MKKNYSFFSAVLLALGCVGNAFAQTDITAEYLKNADLEGSYSVFNEPKDDRAIYAPEGWNLTWSAIDGFDMSIMTLNDKATDSFSAFTVIDEATRGKQTYWGRLRWGSNQTVKLSQTVNLSAGVYRLSADVMSFSSDRNLSARLFAGAYAQVDAMPINAKEDNWNTLECNFYVENDGEIELGFKAIAGSAAEQIFAVDNFKLYKLDAEEPSEANPVSMTGYIVNPTFNSNIDGWKSTTGAQNVARATNKSGDIAGGFYENWNGSPYSGTMEQTINNLPLGKYTLKIAAFREGGSGEVYAFANENTTAVTTNDGVFYEVPVNVTDGTMTIGIKSVNGGANWMGLDNASLTYLGADLSDLQANLASLRETAATLKDTEEVMSSICRKALNDALTETENVEATVKALKAAANKLSVAVNNANTSIANMKIFNGGVVATDELDNWSCTTGNKFQVNTWSTEGNNDGSNMTTPFIENWVNKGGKLDNGVIAYTLEGIEPGTEYSVTALVRVLNENGEASTGLSMYANDKKKVVADGTPCNMGFFKEMTVSGKVGEDGVLKVGFEIEDATFNWVSFKNITFGAPVYETEYDLAYTLNPENGSEVESYEILLTFDAKDVDATDKSYGLKAVDVNNPDTKYTVIVSWVKDTDQWKITAMNDAPYEALTIPGTYQVVIPQGAFGDANYVAGKVGHANAEFTLTYTIAGETVTTAYDLEATSDPEVGGTIEGGLEVVLTFNGVEKIFGDDNNQYELLATNTETGAVYPASVVYPEEKENTCLISVTDNKTWQTLTTPGTYEIVIPQGTFGDADWKEGNGGHANPEWTLTYTIAGDVVTTAYDLEVSANPEIGSYVNGNLEGEIIFPIDVEYDEERMAEAYVYDSNGNMFYAFMDYAYDGSLNKFTFAVIDESYEPVSTPGIYTLVIPQGTFGDADWKAGKGGHANPEYELTFNVVKTEYDLEYTPSVENEGTIEEGGLQVMLTFNGIEKVYGDDVNQYEMLATNKETGDVYPVSVIYPDEDGENKAVITATDNKTWDVLMVPGTYEIVIPQGTFGDADWKEGKGGHANSEWTLTYTIAGAAVETVYDVKITANAEATEDQLGELIFSVDRVEYNEELVGEVFAMNTETGDKYFVYMDFPEGKEFNKMIIYSFMDMNSFEPVRTPGTYTIVIPQGTFGDVDWIEGRGGHANAACELTFTIADDGTGINNVAAENEKVNVYTLKGVQVLKNADRKALKTLKKGIYIVNGKKVILK